MPPSVASVADTDLSTELSTVQTSSDRTLITTAAVAAKPSYAIFARPKSILQQIKAQKNIQDGDLGPNYKDWPFILSKKASYIQARLLKRHPRTSWISDYGVFLVEIDRDTGAEGPTCWCCGLCGEIYAVKATSSAANHLEKKHHRYRDSSESEPPTKKRRTVLQQQRDATRIPVARSAEDCFKEAIVDWVVSNNIPFRGIENGAFRDILMLLNPSLTRALLPESHHTVKAWVQARYHCEFDVIKTMLAGGITKRHLSFDLWTSPNSYGLLAIIAHFLDANKVLQGLETRRYHHPAMEVAGLAVGVVALASIFKDCIDIISNISAVRSMGRDAEVLNTKLDIEKTLFLQWAEGVRLLRGDCDRRLYDGVIGQAVEKVLNTIRKLADESGDIQTRYGLRTPQQYEKIMAADETAICHPRMVRFTKAFEQLIITQARRPTSTSSPFAKIRWVAVDKEKLERLINDLSYFISKLNELVPSADSSTSLFSMAAEDIGRVDDFAKLRVLRSSDFRFQHATGPESYLIEAARTSFETMCRKKVLKTLWFLKIDDRRTFISPAHSETLQWALRPPAADQRWADFPEWLRSESGLYWVSGKAGCGKSTLMKHLYHHKTTKKLLSKWAAGSPLITGCFFFWYLGTPGQKTYEGLTRTLLYHILDSDPSLIPQLLPEMWQDVTESNSEPSLTLPTFAETQSAFERLSRTPVKVCLFIDGLDEYSGDFQDGISFIESLCRHPNLKVVVSSRPEPDFIEAFASKPMLRMQDLTKSDIRKYVLDSVGSHPYLRSLTQRNHTQDRAKQLLAGLIDKADGIFLWIVLACRSVLKGFSRRDRIPELERRVAKLPEELGAMFAYMLGKIDKRYQIHCAKFLRICFEALSDKTMTAGGVPTVALALLDEHSDNLMSCPRLPATALGPDEIENIRTSFPVRLSSLCGGLLEIQWDVGRFVPAPWNPDGDPIVETQVVFIHRSVAEYLDSDATWAMECLYIPPGEFDARIALACLPMYMVQLGRTSGDGIYDGFRLLQAAQTDAPHLVRAALLDFQAVVPNMECFRTPTAQYLRPGPESRHTEAPPDMVALVLAVELGVLSFVKNYVATHRRVSIARLSPRYPLLYHAIKRPLVCSNTAHRFHDFGLDADMIRYLLQAGCQASERIQVSSSAWWGGTVTMTPWDVWTDGEWARNGNNVELYVELTEAFVDSGTIDGRWARDAKHPDFMAAFQSNLVGFNPSRVGQSDRDAQDIRRRGQRILDRLFGTAVEVDNPRAVKRRRLGWGPGCS